MRRPATCASRRARRPASRAASRPGIRPISRRAISRAAGAALAAALFAAPSGAAAPDARAAARSGGNDRPAAERIAAALLRRVEPAQLLKVRCERAGPHVDCGLIVAGTHFHERMTIASWDAEIASLVAGAFAAAPQADEIDCWATVPLDAGHGAVVSGDAAVPTAATVFSITVPRGERGGTAARLRSGDGVFWDAAFRASLAKGTRG